MFTDLYTEGCKIYLQYRSSDLFPVCDAFPDISSGFYHIRPYTGRNLQQR